MAWHAVTWHDVIRPALRCDPDGAGRHPRRRHQGQGGFENKHLTTDVKGPT